MVEFKIFGIPIRVEPSFWITLAILGLIGSDLSSTNGILMIALFVLAGFCSILIHELGHALVIRKFKLPAQIVLSSFGGYAMFPAGILSRKKSFLVTAAGPFLQIIAGVACLYFVGFKSYPANMLEEGINTFIIISLFWAILNCLPIYPLDGGQMLSAIVGPKRQAGLHLTGVVVAVLVACLALYTNHLFGAVLMGMLGYQNFQHWQRLKG